MRVAVEVDVLAESRVAAGGACCSVTEPAVGQIDQTWWILSLLL